MTNDDGHVDGPPAVSVTAAVAGDTARGSTQTGAGLREARLRRGLTITEVAADTRINPAYLEAMEAERWELLPAPVYARGFLRSYARYLRFDDAAIERMVPRNLPRPRDLEPAPGLRRSSAQASLSLPSFGWLRREPRLPVRDRDPERVHSSASSSRLAPVSRSPAPSRPGPLARRTTFGPPSRSTAAAFAERALASSRRAADTLASRSRADPLVASSVGGAVLLALVLGVYLWPGRGDAPAETARSTAVAPSPGPQRPIAGPEPAGTTTPVSTPVAPREGAMPDLVGLARRDAEDELGRLGLAFVVIEVATPASPPGTVYNQSPQAGKDVKRGDSVTLLVARAQ